MLEQNELSLCIWPAAVIKSDLNVWMCDITAEYLIKSTEAVNYG